MSTYQKLFALQGDIFKTIANEKRLEIIQLLANRELTVSEMVAMLGIRQANLSQHLMVMREHRLVETRREGLKIYYRLTDQRISEACALVRTFLKQRYRSDDHIAALLDREQSKLYPVARDHVCGMRLSISEAAGSYEDIGYTYYFCARGCQERFVKDPERYKVKENVHG